MGLVFLPIVKKVLYYKNFILLFKVFYIVVIVAFRLKFKPDKVLALAKVAVPGKKYSTFQEIKDYLSLVLRVKQKLGLRETCFSYSIAFCRILRQCGITARIVFAARKSDGAGNDFPLAGHCWVDALELEPTGWKKVFLYP